MLKPVKDHMLSEITVEKNKLLKTLQINREKHIEIVKEAKVGYIKRAEEVFREKLDKVVSEKIVDIDLKLKPPQDYSKFYNEAISMLEWEQSDIVVLERTQFNQLVLDNWTWKNDFLYSNVEYSTVASGCYYGVN